MSLASELAGRLFQGHDEQALAGHWPRHYSVSSRAANIKQHSLHLLPDWQKANSSRLTEIGGLNTQDPARGFWEFSGTQESQSSMWGKPSAAQLAITPNPQLGDGGPNMTLNHSLSSLGIIPNATVADIMDTQGGYLCYVYA